MLNFGSYEDEWDWFFWKVFILYKGKLFIFLNLFFYMFTRFSLGEQRRLESFLGIIPEASSGPCDKGRTSIVEYPSERKDLPIEEIAYTYKYNPETGEVEYQIPSRQ